MSGTMPGLSQYGLGSPYVVEERPALVGAQFKEVYDKLSKKPTEEVQEFFDLNKEHYSFWNKLVGVFSLQPTKTKINIDAAKKVLEERIAENTA